MTDYDPADRPEPLPGQPVIRAVPHPDELNPRGITITCDRCGARRGWLLLNVRAHVFVRCRCAHEWNEPDLTRADCDQHYTEPDREWDDFNTAMTSLGYDGLLAGATWN
ncbi:hypothetical protein GXW83_01180 [Streptacidiphilus sp. PB12-B1b]|uniref:hypothetical protein n=1 Tax=Streptacidiphilus sp. PB12-B1b TaxID=2705012 RepID=UPI0015FCEE53|nr:hypothetical protein [Streptacidiphilus sp. PB12-B1b]QMU74600.1 hypothetical protein GXW83_01180 [Streptacidiphilus sp. PB12-B1b]